MKTSENEKPNLVVGTLIYLLRQNVGVEELALALKGQTPKAIKRGLAGKRNTYGGGLEKEDVSIAHCATRELEEECGVVLKPESIEKVAVITFRNLWGDYECHFFLARKDDACPHATQEMLDPKWFQVNDLPFDQMMHADTILLPKIFARSSSREILIGEVWHDENMRVMKHDIKILGNKAS